MNVPLPTTGVPISKRLEQFVALRDLKRAIEKSHKEQLAPYNKMLEQLESIILDYLNQNKLDNIHGTFQDKSGATAYKTTRRSATIADGGEFRRFVIGGEQYDLVDWRANAVKIHEFIEEHDGTVPPGVNYSEHVQIGVRKS
jgi:hypothetical protein